MYRLSQAVPFSLSLSLCVKTAVTAWVFAWGRRPFLYEVKTVGEECDRQVPFDGQVDLRTEEGIYKWTTSIANGVFNGIRQGQNNPEKKGTFVVEQKNAADEPDQ